MKKSPGILFGPANPVDGRANTTSLKAGFDQAFLRCVSPVKGICKPIGIRPINQTSIERGLRSNRPSHWSNAVKSKMRNVSRKGRRKRSHPRAKRPSLALNRTTKCHPPGRGCGAGEPYDTTPDKNKGLVVEKRAPGNVVSRFQYHWTGRIKQAQTINGGTVTTVDYEYDTEGNRFIKRTDLGGIVTEIHDLSSDYRVYADGSSEVHTIEIRNGNDPVARFRFQDNHHNSGVWAPSSLFGHRLGADLVRIASLEGGITKLPSLLGFAFSDAYYAVKLLPQIQNKARLLVFLYWTLASIVALAALVLLVRAWRRNPDEGPGLLPVGVYRFGSVLALLSFSATGCIVVPQTQDGSEYLLAANGLFRSGAEGGESNIMSVLGVFYYITAQNGSTDIVTNSDGVAVARFVYEPFGKVNSDLTDLDPDRNGIHYGEQFQFTGQEYEPETGLYNYKARIYDPETGRFLQPDPVHTDQPGQDNWDRYQYVWNNPVNFTDPTGMSTNYVHMFNQIMKNMFHGFNHAIKNGIHGNNRIMREIAHNFNGLFPGHQGNRRFSISEARMKDAANFWDSVAGKKGFWGFLARVYREYLSGIFENPVALAAIGAIITCVFACAPFFAYAAGVAGFGTAVAFSEAAYVGGLFFTGAGWGAGYLLGGMSRTTLTDLNFDKRRANAGGYLGASVAAVTVAGVFGYGAWKGVISPFLENSFIGQMPVEGHPGLTMFDATKLSLSWGLSAIDLLSGDYQSAVYGFTTAYKGIPIPFGGLKWLYKSVAGGYNARL